MKIAVNLLPFREKLAGAGRYAQKIITELVNIDNKNQYYLFISEKGKINFSFSNPNVKYVTSGFNPDSVFSRIFYEQFIFPFKLKQLSPDIIFTPSVAVPAFYKGKFYTTIHDIAYKKILNKYPYLRRKYVAFITKLAFNKSDKIFTVSNFSKKELLKEFGEHKNILVTYNAVDEMFQKDFSEKDKNEFRQKYNLPEKYFLYVGAVEPGKNLDKLFIAFAEYLKRYKSKHFLVITSGINWKENELMRLVEILNIKRNVINLPYISEQELPLLYQCSTALAYLSSYEGFGLPVLEGMSAGIPVVSSNSEAIIEFAQDGIFSVNPENVDKIVETFHLIAEGDPIVSQKVERAKIISGNYSWRNSAQIILNEFNK